MGVSIEAAFGVEDEWIVDDWWVVCRVVNWVRVSTDETNEEDVDWRVGVEDDEPEIWVVDCNIEERAEVIYGVNICENVYWRPDNFEAVGNTVTVWGDVDQSDVDWEDKEIVMSIDVDCPIGICEVNTEAVLVFGDILVEILEAVWASVEVSKDVNSSWVENLVSVFSKAVVSPNDDWERVNSELLKWWVVVCPVVVVLMDDNSETAVWDDFD